MSKNSIRGYVVLGILLVLFSVISFAVPFEKEGTFWIAYFFGIIAIAFQIYVFKVAFEKGEGAKSKFYGFPIARVGLIYLIVQVVLSLVEMIVAGVIPVWVAIVINVFPIAFAIIGCITVEVMRDEIERQDVELKKDTNNMRELQSISYSFISLCKDEGTKKMLEGLAEDFKYSDPVSSAKTKDIENELKVLLAEANKELVDDNIPVVRELIIKVKSILVERNRVCKLNKSN